jgi:hypothetical protein
MNQVIHMPRPSVSPGPSGSWTVMEARLITAKVHDLLDEAAARLDRLHESEELPPEVADAVKDTLRAVGAGRESIRRARRSLIRRQP